MVINVDEGMIPQTKPLLGSQSDKYLYISGFVSTVWRAHEFTLLTPRFPGSAESSLLHRLQFDHKTKAEPLFSAHVGQEPSAEAEPAPVSQLQDDAAAAALLHVWSLAVFRPSIQHCAHPRSGLSIRTLHDRVWR